MSDDIELNAIRRDNRRNYCKDAHCGDCRIINKTAATFFMLVVLNVSIHLLVVDHLYIRFLQNIAESQNNRLSHASAEGRTQCLKFAEYLRQCMAPMRCPFECSWTYFSYAPFLIHFFLSRFFIQVF